MTSQKDSDSSRNLEFELAEAFQKVEESVKAFHALLDDQNRKDHFSSLPEEDKKSRLVASAALRDSASIYLDWGWHYLNKLYEVPNPHNPEEDILADLI
jgi:phage terminase large subunit-like protein